MYIIPPATSDISHQRHPDIFTQHHWHLWESKHQNHMLVFHPMHEWSSSSLFGFSSPCQKSKACAVFANCCYQQRGSRVKRVKGDGAVRKQTRIPYISQWVVINVPSRTLQITLVWVRWTAPVCFYVVGHYKSNNAAIVQSTLVPTRAPLAISAIQWLNISPRNQGRAALYSLICLIDTKARGIKHLIKFITAQVRRGGSETLFLFSICGFFVSWRGSCRSHHSVITEIEIEWFPRQPTPEPIPLNSCGKCACQTTHSAQTQTHTGKCVDCS